MKNSHHVSGAKMNLKIDRWLKKKSDSRIFMWVHYFDLHLYTKEAAKLKHPHTWEEKSRQIYDNYAKDIDNILDDLFEVLSKHLDMNSTMIVLSADHGELLGTDRNYLHGSTSVYNQEMNVPLIIHYPDKFRKVEIYENVRTIDIGPTVIEASGLEVPTFCDGQSLFPLIFNKKGKERLCYMEATLSDKYAIVLGDYKFIHNGTNYIKMPKKIVMGNELYNLRKDPMETENIIGKKGKIGRKLERR